MDAFKVDDALVVVQINSGGYAIAVEFSD